MNDELDNEERTVLAQARLALAPTREQTERVLAGARRALGHAEAQANPASHLHSGLGVLPPTAAGIGLKPPLLLACVVAVLGVAAYFVRVRQGHDRPEPAALRAPARAGSALSGNAAPPTAPKTSDAKLSDERSQTSPKLGPPPEARRKLRSTSAPPMRAEQTDLELRTLRRVERALRDDAPQRALALLATLDRRVPAGQLLEERFAAKTVARCALESAARPALLGQFAERHPDSVYLPRVKQSCATQQASSTQHKSQRVDGAPDNQE